MGCTVKHRGEEAFAGKRLDKRERADEVGGDKGRMWGGTAAPCGEALSGCSECGGE